MTIECDRIYYMKDLGYYAAFTLDSLLALIYVADFIPPVIPLWASTPLLSYGSILQSTSYPLQAIVLAVQCFIYW